MLLLIHLGIFGPIIFIWENTFEIVCKMSDIFVFIKISPITAFIFAH